MKKKIIGGITIGASSILLAYAITKLDYKTSQWECNCCGINFRPPFKEYLMAFHTPKKRKLICPICSRKDYFQTNRDFSKLKVCKKKREK